METLYEYMNRYFAKEIFRIFYFDHKKEAFLRRDWEFFESKIRMKEMLAQIKLCEWIESHHSGVDNTTRFKHHEACKFLSRCKLSAPISLNSLIQCRKQLREKRVSRIFTDFTLEMLHLVLFMKSLAI